MVGHKKHISVSPFMVKHVASSYSEYVAALHPKLTGVGTVGEGVRCSAV